MNKNAFYEKELLFLNKFLEQLKINSRLLDTETFHLKEADLGLHHALGLEESIQNDVSLFFKETVKENTLYYVTDEFFCRYIILQLPQAETTTLLSIGPYIVEEPGKPNIIELLQQKNIASQWITILRHYFRNITCLPNEDGLIACLHTFAYFLWGEDNFITEHYIRGLPNTLVPLAVPTDQQKRTDMFSNIKIFEKIYEDENALMNAVAQGQSNKARNILANIPLFALEQRTEATRNLKNHTIIMNTLLRKAAEQGGVHPLYIDHVSSTFARKIEDFSRSDNFLDLWNEMVQKYCSLVSTHTMKKYSLPIQKIITRIDFDISADLSLKATAQYLNMSPSYLSALFKEETGQTLTDYVNKKRMTYAAYLLTYTQSPISTIAQSCGILDDNYFTKLFKKHMHKTPSKFRQDYFVEQKES